MSKDRTYRVFAETVCRCEEEIDLARASLLIAQGEYPQLVIEDYLDRLDQMAAEVNIRITGKRRPMEIIQSINRYLFDECGFYGNAQNYYDPKNSFLNDVLERKTGIPITLSTVYMEIGKRIGFPIKGVGMPGHFIVKYEDETGAILIDPFHKGAILLEEDCQNRLDEIYKGVVRFHPGLLPTFTKRQIIARMLANLKGIYLNTGDFNRAISVIDRILIVNPDTASEYRDRGLLHLNQGREAKALMDFERYLKLAPGAEDFEAISKRVIALKRKQAMLN